MGKVVVICISCLCDRVVEFIDLIEKGRRGDFVIVNIRISGCR